MNIKGQGKRQEWASSHPTLTPGGWARGPRKRAAGAPGVGGSSTARGSPMSLRVGIITFYQWGQRASILQCGVAGAEGSC
jgi:hypothetical protein